MCVCVCERDREGVRERERERQRGERESEIARAMTDGAHISEGLHVVIENKCAQHVKHICPAYSYIRLVDLL